MDYRDKLPPTPWDTFAPPRRYIFTPPLTQALERPRTDTVMFDEAAQDLGIQPAQRNARLVKPHQDVPAGTSIAHDRIGRISIGRALGQELLEQAQALVDLARMRSIRRVCSKNRTSLSAPG